MIGWKISNQNAYNKCNLMLEIFFLNSGPGVREDEDQQDWTNSETNLESFYAYARYWNFCYFLNISAYHLD